MSQQGDGVADALEQRWRELGEFIRDQRHLGQLSLRKLADRAGVSNPYLSQIERGLRRPSAEILQQIAHALEISSETLYIRAGILDERPSSEPDIPTLIRRDHTLNDEQKQSLIHIYRSFQAANGTAGPNGPVDVVTEGLRAGAEDPGDDPDEPSAEVSITEPDR